ncbi:hypothetical protein R5R35_008988 [Gryllus longicercus]|uniref:Zinc finger CCCH domain-containing protein 14 n=1 Tax=Gryllus longicercus TaxID=2509291 RepID=A0AAN9YZR9_9ORTH
MDYIGAEVSHKIRSAIKAKLMELGAYVDEELPDYIMVMVANKRAKAQMDGDLQLFLGSNTSHFTSWLYQVLQKLQEVTVGNADKKSSKISSVMKDSSSVKRKSTVVDSDSHRKEKRRKSSDTKKSKKVDLEIVKDSKKVSDSGLKSSAKLSDTDKYSRSHNPKEFVSSSRSENSESVVSSSADSKTNKKLLLKEKVEKGVDSDNTKRNSLKSSLSNGSSKSEEKNYLSRLRAEALRSRDERIGKLPGASDELRSLVSSKEENEVKGGGKTGYAQPLQRNKIVLMHSDDEDDDEDFINIKADAEAEQLLKEELPREVLETNVSTPETTPALTEPVESQKKIPEGPAPPPPELPTIPLKENLVPKRPFAKEMPVPPNQQPDPVSTSLPPVPLNLPAVPVSSRLVRKRIADSEAEAADSKITKNEEKPVTTAVSVKDRLGVKKTGTVASVKEAKIVTRLGARPVTSGQRACIAQLESDSVSKTVNKRAPPSSLLSRVVMLHDRSRPENQERLSEGRSMKRSGDKEPEEEEEEYDPSNPAVGTVASIVRVKPRPKLPAALQANKNLILKAVAEAQKSVTSAPIRSEPARPVGLWKRTNAGFVRKLENNIGVTLPNRHLQSYKQEEEEDDDVDEDIKPDSTRHVSSGNGHDKIIIKVSSTKPEKGQQYMANTEEMSDDESGANILQYQEECAATEGADAVGSGRAVYPPVGLASRMPRESPQFLVTLDGLDPNMFGSRSTSLDEQATNKEDFDLENVESSVNVESNTPKKAKTPIVYKVESTVEDANDSSTLPKSLERCKYWPSCRLGAKCNFHHPVSPCKTFPKCPFGDKCLYIHPFCKFNSACTRRDCPFVHAAPRTLISPVPRPTLLPKNTFAPICRYFPKCSNLSCKFLHPKACRYGKFCSKQDCNFIHQDLPSVDKLKWTSPFKV